MTTDQEIARDIVVAMIQSGMLTPPTIQTDPSQNAEPVAAAYRIILAAVREDGSVYEKRGIHSV
ncbi:MAG: hypothetical protein IMW98_08590 [Firmicutes bacterium]|nr:hypothetical protein [Bacillota bacterium]MBE3590863.1 hypothetical protein [Bacillota bacterium]